MTAKDGTRHRGPLVLAIDLGTSSIKVATVDSDLRVRRVASARHQIVDGSDGQREHRTGQTWSATMRAARSVLADAADRERVAAIAVTGPRGSLIITDPSGTPTTNDLSWQDRRAATLAGSADPAAAAEFRAITGAAFDPAVGLPKLLWLRETAPLTFAAGWRIATPQSDILRRLGADPGAVDASVAVHLGLLDVRQLTWSGTLLERHDIPQTALPRLVAQGATVGQLGARPAAGLGLAAGLPLIAAASDGICSELGAGVMDPGQRYAYLGTASAIAGPVLAPTLPDDESLILMPGSATDRWRLVGLGMSGASARAWFMAMIGIRDERRFDRLVSSSAPGAAGVAFIPTLAGATAPVRDPRARGVFAGLSLATGRADLARAVLEGVALELGWLNRAIGLVAPASELRLTGGGSRSAVWSQILADVVRAPVARVIDANPGLRGAAAYGWAALHSGSSVLDWARDHPTPVEIFDPDATRAAVYEESAATYAAIRRALHDSGLDERLGSSSSA